MLFLDLLIRLHKLLCKVYTFARPPLDYEKESLCIISIAEDAWVHGSVRKVGGAATFRNTGLHSPLPSELGLH